MQIVIRVAGLFLFPLVDSSGAETLSANTIIELAVPDNLVGAVLGIQGQGINEIISLSGAKITVSKR